MIHTSRQLKALVRNKSNGDKLILKGGFLIASMVGLDNRSTLDTMKTPLKIDISTDDVITPKEVDYEYKLMFEERSIPVLAYNLETVLAEKMETVISRGTLNTRMRDYYDLMILFVVKSEAINYTYLTKALEVTSRKRGSYEILLDSEHILEQIKSDTGLIEHWRIYQQKYDYAADYTWEDIIKNIDRLFELSWGVLKTDIR